MIFTPKFFRNAAIIEACVALIFAIFDQGSRIPWICAFFAAMGWVGAELQRMKGK